MDSVQIITAGIMAAEALLVAFVAGADYVNDGENRGDIVKGAFIALLIQGPAWGRVMGWW